MDLQLIMQTLLYMTFLPGFGAALLYSFFTFRKKYHLIKYSQWLIILTTAILTFSQIMLAVIILNVDTRFEIVIKSAGSWMTTWQLISGSWTSRWGSYHLWTWFTWVVTLLLFLVIRPRIPENEQQMSSRFFEILLWGSVVILFLLMGQRPYRIAEAGAIPLGVNPSLLSNWNISHPPIAFASYTGYFVTWVISSFVWMYNPDEKSDTSKLLYRVDRIATRITWLLSSLVLVFGIIWSHEATWGGYWSWDAVQVIAVLLWLFSAYRLHLHEVGRNKSLYLFLGVLGFPVVFFAAWIITSHILGGLHSYANSPVAPLFLGLTLITLVPLIPGFFKHKWKPLSPVKTNDDTAMINGFNIGVLSFNLLILGNFAIILLELFNVVFSLGFNFGISYPLINIIGFLGIVVGLILDVILKGRSNLIIILMGFVILLAVVLQIVLKYPYESSLLGYLKLGFIAVIMGSITVLLADFVQKLIKKRKLHPARTTSHLAMLFVLITIIANGAGPAVDLREQAVLTNQNASADVLEEKVSLQLIGLEEVENDQGIIVTVNLQVTTHLVQNITLRSISQPGHARYIESAWIFLENGIEVFITMLVNEPFQTLGNAIIGVNLIIEQYILVQPIYISIFFFLLLPVVQLSENRKFWGS